MTNLTSPQTSIPIISLHNLDRNELLDYFINGWQLNEWLFSAISEACFYRKSDPLRHPLIFYYGHTAAFYISKFVMAGILEEGLDPEFEALMDRGVDPAHPEELPDRQDWPSLAKVNTYREVAFEYLVGYIKTVEIPEQITQEDSLWALMMGIDHERIHFETSSVLIRQIPLEDLTPPENWLYAPQNVTEPEFAMVRVPGGKVSLGRGDDHSTFGWDNEYGHLKTTVPSFYVSRHLITNEAFLDFVEQDGYSRKEFWSEKGWEWKSRYKVMHPRFWVLEEGSFCYRALFDHLDMPLDWPVEVNAYEAEAYCAFLGKDYRLMTEAEFRYLNKDSDPNRLNQGCYNLNMQYGSPTAVGSLGTSEGSYGLTDLRGNVWQWLADDYYQFPQFKAHPLYLDFSEPFLGQGMMAGGSWASNGASASLYYRLWFRHCFYQHAGFRVVRSEKK